MSLNSTTNGAIGRRKDFEPLDEPPKTFEDIARAAGSVNANPNTPGNSVTTALPSTSGVRHDFG